MFFIPCSCLFTFILTRYLFADNISIVDEKLMKLAHDVKKTKQRKSNHFIPSPSQAKDGSVTLSPTIDITPDSPNRDLNLRKRHHRG